MKRSRPQLAIALLVLVTTAAVADTPVISLEEYRQQLSQLSAKLESLREHPDQVGNIAAEIPESLTVSTPSGQITVSYRSLKDDLASTSRADAQKRSAMLLQLQKFINTLSNEAAAHDQQTDTQAPRQKLAELLSRREFRASQSGPSTRDVLLGRLFRWLSRLLGRVSFGRSTFDWLQILVYALVGIVLALLLAWVLRRFRAPQLPGRHREIIPFAPSARGWRSWLAEARALAQQQEWRNAIHLAYWAGISYLEENGAWKPDRARTPREYLRLMGPQAAQYAPLSTITRKFEVTWYGNRDSGQLDFDETLMQLEELGCR
jgi:Domain of unknown function (DUF4129)